MFASGLFLSSSACHGHLSCQALSLSGTLSGTVSGNQQSRIFAFVFCLELDRAILMEAPEAFKSTLGGQGPIYAQIAFGSLPVCFRFLDGMFSKIACLHSPTGTSSTTSTTGTGAGAQSGEHAASKPSKQTRDRNKPSKGAATKHWWLGLRRLHLNKSDHT